MDAGPGRVAHGFAGTGDVGRDGAGEAGDGRALHLLGDEGDGLEIAVRGDGEARLDDVDAHGVEQFRNLELLLQGHGGAGALLAVAQGGVEDQNAVLRRRRIRKRSLF